MKTVGLAITTHMGSMPGDSTSTQGGLDLKVGKPELKLYGANHRVQLGMQDSQLAPGPFQKNCPALS